MINLTIRAGRFGSANVFFSSHLPCTGFSYLTAAFSTQESVGSVDDSLFVNDNTFPHPNDDNLYRYGMPLLSRAAHNARLGRTLAYDLYSPSSQVSKDPDGKNKIAYSYHDILSMSTHIHQVLKTQKELMSDESTTNSNEKPKQYMHEPPPRIAFLCNPGPYYIATAFAAWSSGSIAVPLCISHKSSELAYVLKDSDPSFIIDGTSVLSDGRELRLAAREAGLMGKYLCLEDVMADFKLDSQKGDAQQDEYALGANGDIKSIDSPALIIYTSGTTGNPKGVVHTHRNIYHQITDLVTSWGWTYNDAILHFLPLHHVHGVINKLSCAIWSGASVEFMRFNPIKVWERLANKDDVNSTLRRKPTLFMGVPTIFAKMLEVLPQLQDTLQPTYAMSNIRLVVSGSAALPTSIFNRWKQMTGHTILERYGMTEFAMALSNPLNPVEKRLPGFVGMPLPSVEVKIIDEDTAETISSYDKTHGQTSRPLLEEQSQSGELCVKGPTVFSEYWRKPHSTAESFDFEGYFKTGDVAEYDQDNESYHILGRVSADIIKCGGHKLSSLQIERVLLEHPGIEELAVLGVPDETWGERVGLICRLKPDVAGLKLEELQNWAKGHLAGYKIPTLMVVMESDIPKNAMGKVSKKQLVHLFEKNVQK